MRIEGEYPRNNKAPAFLQGLRLIWCRHQESNPGPTDYKLGAQNIQINGLQDSLLRAETPKPP